MPSPIISSLSDSILVGHIQTSIEGAVVVQPETPVRSAIRLLERNSFDQAPVVVDDEPQGYVLLSDLRGARGSVGSVMQPILPNALAGEGAPLQDALEWLAATGFLFLLRSRRVSGFVVPSDLNRQAGRAYFYLGLAALELRLAECVRDLSRQRDVLEPLHPGRASRIRNRLARAIEANVEADVVAEMHLSDLFKVAATDPQLLEVLGMESPVDLETAWREINRMRTRIAHPVRPVLESPDGLRSLLHADFLTHSMISALGAVGPGT